MSKEVRNKSSSLSLNPSPILLCHRFDSIHLGVFHTLQASDPISGKLSVFEKINNECLKVIYFQIEEGFAKFDTSGDARLDYREFCLMIHSRQQQK